MSNELIEKLAREHGIEISDPSLNLGQGKVVKPMYLTELESLRQAIIKDYQQSTEYEAMKADAETIMQILTDPENQPSQYGTVPLSWYENLENKLERMRFEVSESNNVLPNPSDTDLSDPLFNAIWEVTKTWDVNAPEYYEGYCGLNGSHVMIIINAIRALLDKAPSVSGEAVVSKSAYDGAREDLAIWKKRALEAEEKVRIFDQRIVDIGVIAMTPITTPQPDRVAELEATNKKLLEAYKSAIQSIDDYDCYDRKTGKPYFKHDIFKWDLEFIAGIEDKNEQSFNSN